jgi:hypothetical protein
MIYTHVLRYGANGVRSPLDAIEVAAMRRPGLYDTSSRHIADHALVRPVYAPRPGTCGVLRGLA